MQYMTKDELNSLAQELLCDVRNCTARWQQEVTLFEQDFRFCQHHFNELEPVIIPLLTDEVELEKSL